jgi:Flp pilus assembly protein TadD
MAQKKSNQTHRPSKKPVPPAITASAAEAIEQSRARLAPKELALAAGLVVLVLVAFLPCLNADFISLDDSLFVTSNPHVQQGFTWASLRWAFTNTAAANWHPLTWMSHMLDWELFGPKAWGYHLGNILLHTVNTVLLFVVLRCVTGALWRSFVVAVLFALHPMRVESVAWVAERKDVLCGVFFLLTIGAYVSYARRRVDGEGLIPRGATRSGQIGTTPRQIGAKLGARCYYLLALGLFVGGLMSKPIVVTLPFVLLLLDYWPLGRLRLLRPQTSGDSIRPLGRTIGGLLQEKLPFFGLAVAVSVLTVVSQRGAGAVTGDSLTLGARAANALVAYCRYLGKLAWPAKLAIFYPYPGNWPGMVVVGSGLLLIVLTLATVLASRRWPWWMVGWLWFLGTLVPVIGLVQVGAQSMADRYSYLPSIGLFIALTWGGYQWAARLRWRRILLWVAVVALSGIWLGLTRRQAGYWKDSETLFGQALAVTDDNWMAHCNLGIALNKKGQREAATTEFREAVRLRPGYAVAQQNLGAVLLAAGNVDEGLTHLQEAVRLKPEYALAHCNLAVALRRSGRLEEAIPEFRAALRWDPGDAQTHYDLGMALRAAGRMDEAADEFRQAVKWQPNYSKARRALEEMERQRN